MSETAVRELDWYLRDHLFRQSNAGKTSFRRESLPGEMVAIYLRYKDTDLQQLSQVMVLLLESLVARKVLEQDHSELRMPEKLARLQCAKCFYINYLAEAEPRACLRCQQSELHDFPKKKKA